MLPLPPPVGTIRTVYVPVDGKFDIVIDVDVAVPELLSDVEFNWVPSGLYTYAVVLPE
jgi:hypothetical protein